MAHTIPRRLQKCVLLTRPYDDSLRLKKKLVEQGLEVLINPLLKIVPNPFQNPLREGGSLAPFEALILTSRHAVPWVCQLQGAKEMPLYVVGQATEKACRDQGFKKIKTARESVASLLDLLRHEKTPHRSFLYVRGEHIACDLKKLLTQEGRLVHEVIAYRALPVLSLTNETKAALVHSTLTDVVFYSLRTADLFMRRIHEGSLEKTLAPLTAHVMSGRIKDFLQDKGWGRITLF